MIKLLGSKNKVSPSYTFLLYGFGLLVLLAITAIRYQFDIPFKHMTVDPVVELQGDPMTGILSNIGILLWCCTTALCLFLYFIHRHNKEKRPVRNFFLFASLITLLLLTDDLFLLHDVILPELFHLRERYIVLTYCLLVAIFLYSERTIIFQTSWWMLLLALGFFGISIFIDFIIRFWPIAESYILEDGSKFLGIIGWCIYFTHLAYLDAKGQLSISLPEY